MEKVLVVCGHPHLEYSRVNSAILEQLASSSVTLHRLGEAHQGYQFDVASEQAKLIEHDRIVLLFPLYWYSVPALMKKWFDDVLLPGFAYARGGDKLQGKEIMVVTTVGAVEEGYRAGGFNRFTIDELMRPIEQLSYYVKARYLPPVAIFESVFIDPESLLQEAIRAANLIQAHHEDPSIKYEQMLLKAEEMAIDLIS